MSELCSSRFGALGTPSTLTPSSPWVRLSKDPAYRVCFIAIHSISHKASLATALIVGEVVRSPQLTNKLAGTCQGAARRPAIRAGTAFSVASTPAAASRERPPPLSDFTLTVSPLRDDDYIVCDLRLLCDRAIYPSPFLSAYHCEPSIVAHLTVQGQPHAISGALSALPTSVPQPARFLVIRLLPSIYPFAAFSTSAAHLAVIKLSGDTSIYVCHSAIHSTSMV